MPGVSIQVQDARPFRGKRATALVSGLNVWEHRLAALALSILLLVAGACSSESTIFKGGFLANLGSNLDDNDPDNSVSSDTELQVQATRPYCCNVLERTFSVLLDGQSLPSGSSCTWDFGDGHSRNGCNVDHVFPWAGEYTVVLDVTLPGGRIASTQLSLQVGTQSGPTDDGLVASLRVETDRDMVAVPGVHVQLRAAITVIPHDSNVSVFWRQVLGHRVELTGAATLKPTFLMPNLALGSVLKFEVLAAAGSLTTASTVSVLATDENVAWADDPQQEDPDFDATVVIQGAIDSGAGTVVIPNIGKPWVVGPIMLRSDLRLVIEPGVVLEAKPGAYPNNTDSVLTAINVENIIIDAYGATIRMPRDEYIEPFDYPNYVKGEWRHGVNLRGAKSVQVLGIHVDGTGGDGIYIGPTVTSPRNGCTDITVLDCRIDRSYRNGIGIVAGENIFIDGCAIAATGGTAPQAGMVMEPAAAADRLVNVEVYNTSVDANSGSGFVVNVNRLRENSEPVSVLISDCQVSNSHQSALRAMMGAESAPRGTIEFRRCNVDTMNYSGVWAVWDPAAPIKLRFSECRWRNVARYPAARPLEVSLIESASSGPGGGIEFSDCMIHDTNDRDPFRLFNYNASAGDISGYILIVNTLRGAQGLTNVSQCPQLILNYVAQSTWP